MVKIIISCDENNDLETKQEVSYSDLSDGFAGS